MIKLHKIIHSYVPDHLIDLLLLYNRNFLGGLNLTLAGFGFSPKDQVYVGGKACRTLSSSTTQTVCLIPPSVSTTQVLSQINCSL